MVGGTGTPFVVVGADTARFVQDPELTAVNCAVTITPAPAVRGPTLVQITLFALVTFAEGRALEKLTNALSNVSVTGTVLRVTLPVLVIANVNITVSPTAAGRFVGEVCDFTIEMDG